MPIDLIADVQPARAGGRGGRGGGIKGTAHVIIPSKATNGEPHYKKELLCDLADAGTFIVGLQKQCGRCVKCGMGRRTPFCGGGNRFSLISTALTPCPPPPPHTGQEPRHGHLVEMLPSLVLRVG